MTEWTEQKKKEVLGRQFAGNTRALHELASALEKENVRYMEERESARQAIMKFFSCLKEGELKAGIDLLAEERDSW